MSRLVNTCRKHAPARQDHGLRALVGLAGDASHMRKVGAPLPAVQPVLPEFAHPDSLQAVCMLSSLVAAHWWRRIAWQLSQICMTVCRSEDAA